MYYPDTSTLMCYVNQEQHHEKAKSIISGKDYKVFYLVKNEIRGLYERRHAIGRELKFYLPKFQRFMDIKKYLLDKATNKNEVRHFNKFFNDLCSGLSVKDDANIDSSNSDELSLKIAEIFDSQSSRFMQILSQIERNTTATINFENPRYKTMFSGIKLKVKPETSQDHDFKILVAGVWYGYTNYPGILVVSNDTFFIEKRDSIKEYLINWLKLVGESELPFKILFISEVC